MPTFKVFRAGKEVDSCRGANPETLRKMVAQHAMHTRLTGLRQMLVATGKVSTLRLESGIS